MEAPPTLHFIIRLTSQVHSRRRWCTQYQGLGAQVTAAHWQAQSYILPLNLQIINTSPHYVQLKRTICSLSLSSLSPGWLGVHSVPQQQQLPQCQAGRGKAHRRLKNKWMTPNEGESMLYVLSLKPHSVHCAGLGESGATWNRQGMGFMIYSGLQKFSYTLNFFISKIILFQTFLYLFFKQVLHLTDPVIALYCCLSVLGSLCMFT